MREGGEKTEREKHVEEREKGGSERAKGADGFRKLNAETGEANGEICKNQPNLHRETLSPIHREVVNKGQVKKHRGFCL